MPMKWFMNISSMEELRNHYKKLLIKYHPDNNSGSDTTAIMQEINAEYDLLLKQFTSKQTSSKSYDYSTEKELTRVLAELIKLSADITIELIGSWIWVSGNTYPIRDKLKELNLKWASKKQMWYWGTAEGKHTSPMEMSFIRAKYGSVVYYTEEEMKIGMS